MHQCLHEGQKDKDMCIDGLRIFLLQRVRRSPRGVELPSMPHKRLTRLPLKTAAADLGRWLLNASISGRPPDAADRVLLLKSKPVEHIYFAY